MLPEEKRALVSSAAALHGCHVQIQILRNEGGAHPLVPTRQIAQTDVFLGDDKEPGYILLGLNAAFSIPGWREPTHQLAINIEEAVLFAIGTEGKAPPVDTIITTRTHSVAYPVSLQCMIRIIRS
jgi:hypothetical protein